MVLEVCIDSVESAIAAERGGAATCGTLQRFAGRGITPGAGLIASVRKHIAIDLFVMIRPRGGDFCYTYFEFEVMQEEIRHARRLGADGIVLGLLDEQGGVDVSRTRKLVELARPLPVTFHRAIDMTPNSPRQWRMWLRRGRPAFSLLVARQMLTVACARLRAWSRQANGRIAIMAGGGITADSIAPSQSIPGPPNSIPAPGRHSRARLGSARGDGNGRHSDREYKSICCAGRKRACPGQMRSSRDCGTGCVHLG